MSTPSPIAEPLKYVELAKFSKMPSVQRDLRLEKSQITELEVIDKETRQHVSDLLRGMGSRDAVDRKAIYLEIQREMDLSRQLCEKVLSAEQLHRIRQLAFQFISRNPSTAFGLMNSKVVEELKITPEQSLALREKAAAVDVQLKAREKELKRELEELRFKLQLEVIELLEPQQRGRVKALLGELILLENEPQATSVRSSP